MTYTPKTHEPTGEGRSKAIDDLYDRFDAMDLRLKTLEGAPPIDDPPVEDPPVALTRPMFSHMPFASGWNRMDQAYEFENRLDQGLCTGWFMYYSSGVHGAIDTAWHHLLGMWNAGKRFVILISPKTITKADVVALYEAAPEDMRPWIWLAYWQEPEDDIPSKLSNLAYQENVRICADVAHRYGAKNGTHLQTEWTLSSGKTQPWGTKEHHDAMLGDLDEEIDFCSESAFNFSGSDVLDDLVRTAVPYLQERFPGRPIIFTSVGSSAGVGVQPTEATIARCVTAVRHAWAQAQDLGCLEGFGHYSVGYGDGHYFGPGEAIDSQTVPMLLDIVSELQAES